MDNKQIRPAVWAAVVGSLAVLAFVVVFLEWHRARPSAVSSPAAGAVASTPAAPGPDARTRDGRNPSHVATGAPASPAAEVPYIDGLVYGEIDLREAKALMPDNLYWKLGAPTKDPDVLKQRDDEQRRRNEEYGKVLSGDASEDEVRAYYDYKKKLSSDYLEFSEFMSRRYRDSDNKEFVGMLELAMKMHAERLKELPAEEEDALRRSRERAKIREDWQRQKQEFGDAANPPPDEDDPDNE
jgi:hypothetical protein